MEKKKKSLLGQKAYVSVMLALFALVAITAATVAWFSIAGNTQVYSMRLDITGGAILRFDLVPHATLEEYKQTLSFDEIAEFTEEKLGYNMKKTPLKPVTTEDCSVFTLRDGTVVENETGSYWEFVLHFMSNEDMIVHLSPYNSEDKEDSTLVWSSRERTPEAMRISFSVDGNNMIFDPGMGDESIISGNNKNFGLQNGNEPLYNENSILFSIEKEVDKAVTVRVWMEGTDPACTDELKGTDFAIRLRFEGTDENGNRLNSYKPS